MENEGSQSSSRLKALLSENAAHALSEPWLKNTYAVLREKAHYHLVERPLLGEIGQSAVLIFVALFLLSSAAGVLAARYGTYRESLAHEEFERARGLNAQGLHEQALRHLRSAFHLAHHNPDYQRELVNTLIELERFDEARLQLNDLLKQDPTDAEANLLLARIAAQTDHSEMDDAVRYFQRAIYGLWSNDPNGHRIQTRFELADYLANQGNLELLRAELIGLAADIRDNTEQLERVGNLMLYAKSPETAAQVFERVLVRDSRDPQALAGLGRAQLEMGNFAAAEQSLSRAARANADNEEVSKQLALVREIRGMNPLRRGLGRYARADRARGLIAATYEPLLGCAENTVLPQEVQADMEAAKEQLEKKRRGTPTDEMIEGDINMARRMYQDYLDYCHAQDPPEALERLMAVLSIDQ